MKRFNENWDGIVRKSLVEGPEYVVWGVPPGHKDETLLIAMPGGKPITDKDQANKYKQIAVNKGATKVRIQVVDGGAPDFRKTLNKR